MKKNLLVGAFALAAFWAIVHAAPAEAAVAYVQSTSTVSNNCGGALNAVSAAFDANTTAGNLIVLTFSAAAIDAWPIVSDTAGNTYFHATGAWDKKNGRGLEIYYAVNIVSSPNTVSVSFRAANTLCRLGIHEYSGVATTTPIVDTTVMNVNNTGTTAADGVTSNAVVTRTSGALIFGVAENDSAATTVAAGTGFTKRQSMNGDEMVTEDEIQPGAGSVAATFTNSALSSYLAGMVAFRAAGSAFPTSGVTYVQGNSYYDNTCYAGAIRTAFPAANLAGDLIVVSASYTSQPAGVAADVTITDSRGNTYGEAMTKVDPTTGRLLAVYYALNVSNGTNTVFVAFPVGNTNCRTSVHEYAGVATDTPAVDIVSGNRSASGAATTDGVTSNAATTLTNGALVFGAADSVGGAVPVSRGTGFTPRVASYAGEMFTEDKIQPSAGSVAATFTDATSTGYIAGMVAFRAAGAAFSTPTPRAVQYNGASDYNCTGNKITAPFPGPNSAGNLITVALSYGSPTSTPTISDAQGNVYRKGTSFLWNDGWRQGLALYYAANVRNGTNTITANFSGPNQFCVLAITEYMNVVTSTPLLGAAENLQFGITSTSTDRVSSGAVGYYTVGDLLFGADEVDNIPPAGNTLVGTGFRELARMNGDEMVTEDKLVTVAGQNAATFTYGSGAGSNANTHLLIFRSANPNLSYSTGTLDSTTFDTGVASGAQYNSIMWLGSAPPGTSVKFRFAASNAAGGPWIYTGPDGTANTYYAAASGIPVPLSYQTYNNERYYRYRLFLIPDNAGLSTPRVDGVIVNWSP